MSKKVDALLAVSFFLGSMVTLQSHLADPTAVTKRSGPLPANLLGQIHLKLVSNEKGTLKFEVHNGLMLS